MLAFNAPDLEETFAAASDEDVSAESVTLTVQGVPVIKWTTTIMEMRLYIHD